MAAPQRLSRAGRWIEKLLEPFVERRVALAVRALDDRSDRQIYGSRTDGLSPRDRRSGDRLQVLEDALEAWRVNPLARRIVELTSQYVVGGGLSLECRHEATHRFLQEWWNHRLNRMPVRVFEWCEELSRSGELFVLLSTDRAGMSYLRAVPAAEIAEIETAANDVEQELFVWEKGSLGHIPAGDKETPEGQPAVGKSLSEGRCWKVYRPEEDTLREDGSFETVVLHYAINRPVGALHGESDLAPLLRWLARYAAWLEDRARLNRFRNTFIFWVKARFHNAEERLRRQGELNLNPPNPGSILVTDESEDWSVLAPNLASFEAAEDGLAMKKMVSAGAGIPLHFIAEPESATRTTAESAGGPTFRRFQQRQLYFLWMLTDLAKAALNRRKLVDPSVDSEAPLEVNGSDISARDNASLAAAASTIVGSFLPLRMNGLIDDAELLRMAYRFAGEVVDIEALLARGKAAGEFEAAAVRRSPGRPPGIKIDPISGEIVNQGGLMSS